MDALPVEVIGNILSHLGAARDVVVASAACRKWREAVRRHLHTLSFRSSDWQGYRDLSAEQLEIIITRTIFQTRSLDDLSICLGHGVNFSAAPVIAWLMYTRDSLRYLNYMIQTRTSTNILETCGKQRLEHLVVGYTAITSFEPSLQRFPVLQSLKLSRVSISALDLNLLLSACPKLESLSLQHINITLPISQLQHIDISLPDPQSCMELCSPSLRVLRVEQLNIDQVILEADKLENLFLKDCQFEEFELCCKGSLRVLEIDDVSTIQLDIAKSIAQLEVVDVKDFTIGWHKFYEMISKATKLRSLRLWGLTINGDEEVMDLETIAVSFPKLRELALSYNLVEGQLQTALWGSTLLDKVVRLEIGSTVINEHFVERIGGVLERCPNLKRLVVHGQISEAIGREDYPMIARFTTCLVQLMRKFGDIEIDFDYR